MLKKAIRIPEHTSGIENVQSALSRSAGANQSDVASRFYIKGQPSKNMNFRSGGIPELYILDPDMAAHFSRWNDMTFRGIRVDFWYRVEEIDDIGP